MTEISITTDSSHLIAMGEPSVTFHYPYSKPILWALRNWGFNVPERSSLKVTILPQFEHQPSAPAIAERQDDD